MKKHLETIFGIVRSGLLATITCALLIGPTSALAAINTATWDISGAAQADATFELVSYNLANVTLTKTAFLAADGSELIDGASVPAGTAVDFMIYINNTNTTPVNDISIADVLAPADFVYVPSFLSVGTTGECALQACDAGERAALYAAVANVASEAVEAGDVAGYDAAAVPNPTVSAGSSTGNAQLDVPNNTAWAIVFRATVQ